MESGNGGINGKSGKIITIGPGEISGGKYISFPKSCLEGKCYNLVNIYKLVKIYIYHIYLMTCDHVTNLWLFLIG